MSLIYSSSKRQRETRSLMPEIEFFATQVEIGSFVKSLLLVGCEFIPDLHYAVPVPEVTADFDRISSLSPSLAVFLISRRDQIVSPLQLREVRREEKHFFYVDARTGGPTMLLYWGRDAQSDGCQYLSSTSLGIYPWYTNSVTREREKPSLDFRQFYNLCTKEVRRGRRKIKPGVREFWVSPNVEELVKEGLKLVGLEEFSVSQILAGSPKKRPKS